MSKKCKVYLDFDGTLVEHEYPNIGRANFGWVEVIEKLQKAGHEVILNTMRANFNDDSLHQALDYINQKSCMFYKNRKFIGDKEGVQISTFLVRKVEPPIFDMDSFIKEGIIFIDDICKNIPLKESFHGKKHSPVVNWDKLDKIFKEYEIY